MLKIILPILVSLIFLSLNHRELKSLKNNSSPNQNLLLKCGWLVTVYSTIILLTLFLANSHLQVILSNLHQANTVTEEIYKFLSYVLHGFNWLIPVVYLGISVNVLSDGYVQSK